VQTLKKGMYLPLKMRVLVVCFIAFFWLASVTHAQTKVYLVPVLHGLHKTNYFYPYDSVKAVVARTGADVVAVEMRPEDMAQDSSYLKGNYPYEMWMMPHWFGQKTIEGFDWLGQDIEGKPIPPRYWQEVSTIKKLQARLNSDAAYTAQLKSCQLYADERMRVLSTQSLKAILASNDAILTKEYYNCLEQRLRGSDYEELTQFYNRRNQKMMTHLNGLLEKHKGKTITVVTGADHYPYLLEHLNKRGVQVARLY
jgi:hypothetical protein